MDSSQAKIFAIAWCVLTASAFVHARSIGCRFWAGLGVLFGVMASIRWTAWNVDLWQWVRGLMEDAGIYGERYWYKAGIAVVLCVSAIFIGRASIRSLKVSSKGTRLAFASSGALFFFIVWMTASLDFILPKWFIRGPVRIGFESLAPLLTLVGLIHDWREYEPWPQSEGAIVSGAEEANPEETLPEDVAVAAAATRVARVEEPEVDPAVVEAEQPELAEVEEPAPKIDPSPELCALGSETTRKQRRSRAVVEEPEEEPVSWI